MWLCSWAAREASYHFKLQCLKSMEHVALLCRQSARVLDWQHLGLKSPVSHMGAIHNWWSSQAQREKGAEQTTTLTARYTCQLTTHNNSNKYLPTVHPYKHFTHMQNHYLYTSTWPADNPGEPAWGSSFQPFPLLNDHIHIKILLRLIHTLGHMLQIVPT